MNRGLLIPSNYTFFPKGRYLRTVSFAVFIALAQIIACPQPYASSDELFSLSLVELMAIEVTGSTLRAESLKDVPAAVTVLSHGQIKAMGISNLGDLIGVVAGYQSYRSAQSAYHYPFSSRGRRIGTSSAEVLILVDGQRLNEPRTGGVSNLVSSIPVANIERIEFLRGPGAALYGSNAMLGVINIITRGQVNELEIAYGSHNRRHLDLLAHQGVGDTEFDFFIRYDQDEGDTFLVRDSLTGNQTTTRDPIRFADVHFKFRRNNTRIAVHHNEASAHGFFLANIVSDYYATLEEDRQSFVSLTQNFYGSVVATQVGVSYLRTSIRQNRWVTEAGKAALGDAPVTAYSDGATYFEDSEVGLRLDHDWVLANSQHVKFGSEFRLIRVPSAELVFSGGTEAEFRRVLQFASKREIVGLYGQYQGRPFKPSHVTVGLRYDSFSGIGAQLSPRVSWVQDLSATQSIKLLYGEAFRAPAEIELNVANNDAVIGLPNLHPETVKSFDLIWYSRWRQASLSAGYFENRFKDGIAQVVLGNTLQFVNLEQTERTRGFEFELTYAVSDPLLLQASYTRIVEKPEFMFREADQLASLNANYELQRWRMNVTASYHDSRELLNRDGQRIALDSYWVCFGRVGFRVSPDMETFVTVRNLTDTDILTPPSFPRGYDGTPDRGREVRLGLSYQF